MKVIPHLEIPMVLPAAFYRGSLRPAGGLFGGGSLGQNREYPAVRVPARIPTSDGGKRSLPAPLLLHGTRSGTRRNGPVPGGALRHLLNAKSKLAYRMIPVGRLAFLRYQTEVPSAQFSSLLLPPIRGKTFSHGKTTSPRRSGSLKPVQRFIFCPADTAPASRLPEGR